MVNMVRHFLTLYALIVVTLAAVSWGQDQLVRVYDDHAAAIEKDPNHRAVFDIVASQVRDIDPELRAQRVAQLATQSNVDLELFELADIAGPQTLTLLQAGQRAVMNATNGQTWMLQKLSDTDQVLAFKYTPIASGRTPLEWVLSFVFYAAIALVLMLWLWPLTRDLKELERSTMTFGNRNWRFQTRIQPTSQIYPLSQAFRRMAARIDGLISSQKDMTNAMSHEIKTPLARMRFEIEMARAASNAQQAHEHLDHINRDISELNAFVTATLDYAILERAEVALNFGVHDFTQVLPAICDSVRRTARDDLAIECNVSGAATHLRCDAHLIETAVRNMLYNAARYAKSRVEISLSTDEHRCLLAVDDDGPGIPAQERSRVFESFVQLDQPSSKKTGYGLGLAIVKRIVEWHGGRASVLQSHLGGARVVIEWTTHSEPEDRDDVFSARRSSLS
jgi:two-component system, OmpR family, sensor kinase